MGVYFSAPVANAKPQTLTTVSNIAVSSSPRSTLPELTSLEVIKVPAPSQKTKKPISIVDVKTLAVKRAKVKALKARTQKAKPRYVKSSTVKKRTTTTVRKRVYVSNTTGKKSSYNWATPGQCTWGALNKWHNYTGYYLGGFHGNAYTWNERAAAAGWPVGHTPRAHSIVVFEPGVAGASGVGHVAWVTGVSGSRVTFIEMNALAGPYNYNTRTVTHRSGMSYIYAS